MTSNRFRGVKVYDFPLDFRRERRAAGIWIRRSQSYCGALRSI